MGLLDRLRNSSKPAAAAVEPIDAVAAAGPAGPFTPEDQPAPGLYLQEEDGIPVRILEYRRWPAGEYVKKPSCSVNLKECHFRSDLTPQEQEMFDAGKLEAIDTGLILRAGYSMSSESISMRILGIDEEAGVFVAQYVEDERVMMDGADIWEPIDELTITEERELASGQLKPRRASITYESLSSGTLAKALQIDEVKGMDRIMAPAATPAPAPPLPSVPSAPSMPAAPKAAKPDRPGGPGR